MTDRAGQILRGKLPARGGPIGALKGLVFAAAVIVTLVVVVGGLDWVLSFVLPAWLVMPAILVVVTVLVGIGLYALLRFNEWRRRRRS